MVIVTTGITTGLALFLGGALKIWWHIQNGNSLTLTGCLNTKHTIQLSAADITQVHCWGCYALIFGFSLIAGSILWSYHIKPTHLQIRSVKVSQNDRAI